VTRDSLAWLYFLRHFGAYVGNEDECECTKLGRQALGMTAPPDPPAWAELLDWLEGRLPADEAQAVALRLQAAGSATLADVDWLRAFQSACRSVRLASPPPAVRAELRRRFARHAKLPANSPPGLFARLVAALTYDSRAQWASAGLRSASGLASERQLIYATPAAEVEVALTLQAATTPDARLLNIRGQVFAPGEPVPVYAVQLLRAETEAALATTNDLGEFSWAAIPAGEYSLVLSTGEHEVLLPSIQLET
jgi:hypothetical protein